MLLKKRFAKVMLFTLLLALIVETLSITSIYANSTDEQTTTLLKNNQLEASYSVIEKNDKLLWNISYNKYRINSSIETRLKFKLTEANGKELALSLEKWGYDEGWLIENEISSELVGSMQFETSKEITELKLEIQMDQYEDDDDEEEIEEENILEGQEQGPYDLAYLPIVENEVPGVSNVETETSTSSEEDEQTSQSSAPTIEIPEVVEDEEYEDQEETLPISADIVGKQSMAFSNYMTQFNYEDNNQGIFPSHGTNLFNASQTSDLIKNYDFSKWHSEGDSKVSPAYGSNLDFTNGYHDYGDAFLKKIVIPTTEENKFKIQLDILSKARLEKEDLDVVLVLDKSGSMKNSNRNENMINAVKEFADAMLPGDNQGNIRVGLVNYWGNPSSGAGKTNEIQAEVSDYVNTAFTSNARQLKNSSVLTRPPVSGTPITMGLKAGTEVLYNTQLGARPGAKKIMIILTDGAPFTAIKSDYYSEDLIKVHGNGKTILRYEQSRRFDNNDRFYKNGGSYENKIGTINFSDYVKRRYPDLNTYSIGFGIGGVPSAIEVMERISSTPEQYYPAADGIEELAKVFKDISESINMPVKDATLVDPMSDYVTYRDKYQLSALKVNNNRLEVIQSSSRDFPDYARRISKESLPNELRLGNITLGSTQNQLEGIRVEYEIELKPEYFDGKFYQANQPTYLRSKNSNTYSFAVPSVRATQEKRDIKFEKIWLDDGNLWDSRTEISFQLQRRSQNSMEKWQDVQGQVVRFAKTALENELNGTFKDVVMKSGTQKYEYRVVERVDNKDQPVPGYREPTYTPDKLTLENVNQPLQVTNELLQTNIEFYKVGHDNKTPLAGAGFTLYHADSLKKIAGEIITDKTGLVSFAKKLPIGKYILKETTSPPGYKVMEPLELTIKQLAGQPELVIEGLPKDKKVVNYLKDFSLKLEKLDQFSKPVSGVTFKLIGLGSLKYEREQTSDKGSENLFTFSELKPGRYELSETKVPDSHDKLKQPIELVISETGRVTIDGEIQEDVLMKGNTIHLKVKNKAKGLLPSTGGPGYRRYWLVGRLLFLSVIGLSTYYVYRNRQEVN